jgi:hypothetical protein
MNRLPLLHLAIALFQIAAGLFALGLLLGARAFGSEPGSIHLQLGGSSAVWDAEHGLGLGGAAGLALAAGPMAELEARAGYDWIPARVDAPGAAGIEAGSAELAAWFAPYRGLFQPMIGGHLGMARIDGAWRWELGMDAKAVFCVNDAVQLYGSATPGLLAGAGAGAGEAWLRVGAGARFALRR